ncbi:NAD(P)/FAD-dependent oxidoreductase [Nonomuraea dietziae]|uniref:flavin-containing monooxygenase n=1 Tax=Nonomuraea dietziae TaxID=65515 RepID=UPI0031CE44EE
MRVAIIGAGFGGLCMAIRLELSGIADYTVFEKAGGLGGGTWRDNSYPGAGCDIPSHLYSYSFEKYASWTRRYPEQPEILAYLDMCADKYGVRPKIRFDTEVRSARFDGRQWQVTTDDGTERFDAVVSSVGQLNRPALSRDPGNGELRRRLLPQRPMEARARPHRPPRRGDRNGSSAAQFIPRIQPLAERLDVFQRHPQLGDPQSPTPPSAPPPGWRYTWSPACSGSTGVDLPLRRGHPLPRSRQGLEREPAEEAGARTPPRAGRRPRTARQAHPGLPRRLQAGGHRQLLLSRPHQAERRGGHRPDRPDHPEGGGDLAGPERGRHDHLRHRLPHDGVPAADRVHRHRGGARSPTSGRTAPRPISASPCRTSRTCSCSTARTPTSGTTPSSS